MNEIILLYLAFGCLAGILSGLFGIGGGVVIVPFLAWQFGAQGFAPELIMVAAVATSLATIVITSLSAVHAHHRRRAVDWLKATNASLSGQTPLSLVDTEIGAEWILDTLGRIEQGVFA